MQDGMHNLPHSFSPGDTLLGVDPNSATYKLRWVYVGPNKTDDRCVWVYPEGGDVKNTHSYFHHKFKKVPKRKELEVDKTIAI